MKRRSFLRFMGLAPAAPVAALAASKMAEAAESVPKPQEVEMYSNTFRVCEPIDDDSSIAVFRSTVSWCPQHFIARKK